MIQRIQSVYLLVGTLLLALFVGLGSKWSASAAALHSSLPTAMFALAAITGVAGFVALLLYKNRALQVRLIEAAQWLDLSLVLVLLVALGMLSFGSEEVAPQISPVIYATVLLPVAAYVFFSLARRAVQKDIALVRSVDRLR